MSLDLEIILQKQDVDFSVRQFYKQDSKTWKEFWLKEKFIAEKLIRQTSFFNKYISKKEYSELVKKENEEEKKYSFLYQIQNSKLDKGEADYFTRSIVNSLRYSLILGDYIRIRKKNMEFRLPTIPDQLKIFIENGFQDYFKKDCRYIAQQSQYESFKMYLDWQFPSLVRWNLKIDEFFKLNNMAKQCLPIFQVTTLNVITNDIVSVWYGHSQSPAINSFGVYYYKNDKDNLKPNAKLDDMISQIFTTCFQSLKFDLPDTPKYFKETKLVNLPLIIPITVVPTSSNDVISHEIGLDKEYKLKNCFGDVGIYKVQVIIFGDRTKTVYRLRDNNNKRKTTFWRKELETTTKSDSGEDNFSSNITTGSILLFERINI